MDIKPRSNQFELLVISKVVGVEWPVYLWLVWDGAYRKRSRHVGKGCGSLVTPGRDRGCSPHLVHRNTRQKQNDGRVIGANTNNTTTMHQHWTSRHKRLYRRQCSNYRNICKKHLLSNKSMAYLWHFKHQYVIDWLRWKPQSQSMKWLKDNKQCNVLEHW